MQLNLFLSAAFPLPSVFAVVVIVSIILIARLELATVTNRETRRHFDAVLRFFLPIASCHLSSVGILRWPDRTDDRIEIES